FLAGGVVEVKNLATRQDRRCQSFTDFHSPDNLGIFRQFARNSDAVRHMTGAQRAAPLWPIGSAKKRNGKQQPSGGPPWKNPACEFTRKRSSRQASSCRCSIPTFSNSARSVALDCVTFRAMWLIGQARQSSRLLRKVPVITLQQRLRVISHKVNLAPELFGFAGLQSADARIVVQADNH